MLYDKVLERLIKNQETKKAGAYVGIPFPFERFRDYYPAMEKSHSIGLLAGTGCGKSTLLRYLFVYYLYDFYKRTGYKLKVFYFCLEDAKEKVYDFFICNYLYKEHGIKITIQELNSVGDRAMPDFVREKLENAHEYFKEFEEIIVPIDGYSEPKEILGVLEPYAESTGTTKTYEVIIEDRVEIQKIYESDIHTFVLIDNAANIDAGNEYQSERLAIVDLCKKVIRERLCNHYKFTCVTLLQNDFVTERQQFSTNGKSIQGKVEPSLSSIGEAKTVARSMHVIFTLFDPSRFEFIRYPMVNEANAHRAYNIELLGNKFRSLRVIKNNFGDTGMRGGLLMNPIIGTFEELPPADSEDMKHIYEGFKKMKSKFTKSNVIVFGDEGDESPF